MTQKRDCRGGGYKADHRARNIAIGATIAVAGLPRRGAAVRSA